MANEDPSYHPKEKYSPPEMWGTLSSIPMVTDGDESLFLLLVIVVEMETLPAVQGEVVSTTGEKRFITSSLWKSPVLSPTSLPTIIKIRLPL